jgi:hypothetical protein
VAEFVWKKEEKRGRGRPALPEQQLRWSRDELVGLLENSWPDVGWGLIHLKSRQEVPILFALWNEQRVSHLIKLLLRPTTKPATARALAAQRKQVRCMLEKAHVAYTHEQTCRDLLNNATRALGQEGLSRAELDVVEEECKRRRINLETATEEHRRFNEAYQQATETLHDGEAYFAQQELVSFCRSGRYRINPLQTANALAGLPNIGWRQSSRRCASWDCTIANGLTYEIFLLIERICETTGKPSVERFRELLLVEDAESTARNEVRKYWYYLRRSIESVSGLRLRNSQVPFAIASQYFKRTMVRSAVDLVFEEEERL